MSRPACLLLALCLALPVLPLPVVGSPRANMAPPVQPGEPIGEPTGDLADLAVLQERLVIDLRPVAEPGTHHAVVEAAYQIRNPKAASALELFFVTRAMEGDGYGVWMNGEPVAARPVREVPVPEAWRAPETTPALREDADPIPYQSESFATGGLRFDLDLPEGTHEVRVRHRARLSSTDRGDAPNRLWQFAYSLTPTRQWFPLGTLKVTVLLPEDEWALATSPPLSRNGSRATGFFNGLPDDVLILTAQAPRPAGVTMLQISAYGVPLLLCLVGGMLVGVHLVRWERSAWWAPAPALVICALAATIHVLLLGVATSLGDSNAYSYAAVTQALFVTGPILGLAGLVLTHLTALMTTRRITVLTRSS